MKKSLTISAAGIVVTFDRYETALKAMPAMRKVFAAMTPGTRASTTTRASKTQRAIACPDCQRNCHGLRALGIHRAKKHGITGRGAATRPTYGVM